MRGQLPVWLSVSFGLCVLQQVSLAHAQDDSSPTAALDSAYFAVKPMLGVGGTMSTGGSATAGVNLNSINIGGGVAVTGSGSDKLRLSYGGGAQYMHPLHRYFALGGLFAAQSWQSRAGNSTNASRNLLLDLSLVPQGKLAVSDTIELYISVPIGLTVDFFNQASLSAAGLSVSADTGVGYNLSLLFGARFALSRAVGLLAEIGYTRHAFSHDIRVDAPNIPGFMLSGTVANIDLTLEQIALNVGVFF